MAVGYFKHIPDINYDFKSDGKYYLAKDLFRKVSVWNHLQEGITGYTYYRITEGERPDVVASKLYGDGSLYWTFWLVNENLQDLSDWPKSQSLFNKYIDRKYSGICLKASTSTDIVSYDHSKTEEEQLASRKFVLGEKVSQSSSVFGFVTDINPTHNRITLNSVIGTFTANSRVLGPLPTKIFASLDGDGSTTVLGSAETQSTGTILEIYWDNVLQDENSYSIVLTPNDIVETTITFNTAPAAGVIVKVFERKSFVLSSVINEQDAAHHYTDSNDFNTTVSTGNTEVTNLDYERELNEDKHLIRYIEPRYIDRILTEFISLVRN